MNDNKITISRGNSKMGEIPSVSLPPVITCANGCKCAKDCYAVKLCRIYKSVKTSYDRNLTVYQTDPAEYWRQVEKTVSVSRFFRFHVSGDIPDAGYFAEMVRLARRNPHCEMLVFTKKYALVNEWVWWHGAQSESVPQNLHLIFSAWDGMPMHNPYGFPVSHVHFKDDPEAPESWKRCSGNCLDCARAGLNCWTMGTGDHVVFEKH